METSADFFDYPDYSRNRKLIINESGCCGVRAKIIFRKLGIIRVEDLSKVSLSDLLGVKGRGLATASKIKAFAKEVGGIIIPDA